MIRFENVSVTYPGGVKALDNVSLEINEGDFLIIVGMSGAGKSTLLRTVNNLVKPTEGEVFVDSRNVTKANKKELKKLHRQVQLSGLTIVPLKLFINAKGYAKMIIALARGKKLYDKRETIKDRDNKRNLERIKKNFK